MSHSSVTIQFAHILQFYTAANVSTFNNDDDNDSPLIMTMMILNDDYNGHWKPSMPTRQQK